MADDLADIETALLRVIKCCEWVQCVGIINNPLEAVEAPFELAAEAAAKEWGHAVEDRKAAIELLNPLLPWVVQQNPVQVLDRLFPSYSEAVIGVRLWLWLLDISHEGGGDLVRKNFETAAKNFIKDVGEFDFNILRAAAPCEIRQARQRMIAEELAPVFWSQYRTVADWLSEECLNISDKTFERRRGDGTYNVHPVRRGNMIAIRLDGLPDSFREERLAGRTRQSSAK